MLFHPTNSSLVVVLIGHHVVAGSQQVGVLCFDLCQNKCLFDRNVHVPVRLLQRLIVRCVMRVASGSGWG